MAKLVTRKTKDDQLVAVLVRQVVQLGEVPDGRASHGRDVVDEDDLALERREVDLSALGGGGTSPSTAVLALEIVKAAHLHSPRDRDLERQKSSQP